MSRETKRRAMGVGALFLVAQIAIASEKEDTVRDFVEAFSRHDPAAMIGLVDDAVQWLGIDGAKIAIEAEGKDALRESMTRYFASCASCRSSIESIETFGSRVVVLEVASWEARGEKRAQRAVAVHEFRDGRILRVYYFPAE